MYCTICRNGCGSKIGTQNVTPVNGIRNSNLRPPSGVLTRTYMVSRCPSSALLPNLFGGRVPLLK